MPASSSMLQTLYNFVQVNGFSGRIGRCPHGSQLACLRAVLDLKVGSMLPGQDPKAVQSLVSDLKLRTQPHAFMPYAFMQGNASVKHTKRTIEHPDKIRSPKANVLQLMRIFGCLLFSDSLVDCG